MPEKPKTPAYKKTEKWWLILVVLFYVLYNIPGVPQYGDARGAIIHGALTIIPIWVIVYVGMYILNRQRKLKVRQDAVASSDNNSEEGV
ncbi:hypothetical protein LPY66_03440 [Dehalobacter sp. DCM]|uniref:hypothetical protein n=1 Tax=Dehalobacter sp. DCM TaxID=2907827 RepID=UPI003081D3DE|nr:hypothetical protein LPY66_03440 [Dehalobacter sp. DCM]